LAPSIKALRALNLPHHAAEWSARQRRQGRRVGFVPTMGALHPGHIALVNAAREECEAVAVSIFVNPLQFDDKDDLARYPRQPGEDERMLRETGCDMVFMPEAGNLFQHFIPEQYDLGGLDLVLEGASRPGHFQGVVNVVERLFHYVRPDTAFFGEKDRQQLAVIRHVANRLHWPTVIRMHRTVRADDGLALSSRNQRLSSEERALAPALYRSLQAVRQMAFTGSLRQAREAGLNVLRQAPSITLDYLAIVHPDTLLPMPDWDGLHEAVAMIAARVGPVRLIDNITLHR
jgi:pantoate--beta-alanine ligase